MCRTANLPLFALLPAGPLTDSAQGIRARGLVCAAQTDRRDLGDEQRTNGRCEMRRYVYRLGVAAVALATLAACNKSGTLTEVHELAAGEVLLTSADVRAVNRIPVRRDGRTGAITPDYVTCAEPSPDVAKAVSEAFSLSASLAAKGLPSGVSPQVAAAISRAQSESIAQLGERLATIQLLRDGLYRACEGYANGAVSETIYAVMVSRYDDTMITMLSSELAAGAFGRSLAALESSASSKGTATLDLTEKSEARKEAVGNFEKASSDLGNADTALEDKRAEESQKRKELDEAVKRQEADRAEVKEAETRDGATDAEKKSLAQDLGRSDAEVARLDSELKRTQREIARLEAAREGTNSRFKEAKEERDLALKAETDARSKAEATAAGSITPGQQQTGIAKVLHQIQRKYVENINTDAIEIACLAAMDRNPNSKLAETCGATLLPSLIKEKSALVQAVLTRAWQEKQNAEQRSRVLDVFGEAQKMLGASQKLIDSAKAFEIRKETNWPGPRQGQ